MADNYESALAYLDSKTDVEGAASIRFRDGQIFMFSKTTLESILDKINESGKDRATVFIKSGPEFKDIVQ